MYFKIISTVLILVVLSACQSQSQQIKPTSSTDSEVISDSEWQQSQQAVLAALQTHDYATVTRLIQPMFNQADDHESRWQYLRMALAVMPVEQAEPIMQKALKMTTVKQSDTHLFHFSRLMMQHQMAEEALTVINQAIKIERQEPYIYWRARLLAVSKDLTAAQTDYKWLLAQSPDNSDYLSQYAALLMQMDQFTEAESILAQHKDVPRLQYQRILLLLQQNEFDQARPLYETLMDDFNSESLSAKEQLNYGELALWLEDYDNALKLLTQIDDAEYVYEAKLLMGRVYLALDDAEKALVLFKQVQNAPEEFSIPSFQMASEVYMRQEQPEQAIAVLSEGLRFFKKQPDLLYTRALLYSRMSNIKAAETDFMAIIDKDPEHTDALNALGYTWADNDMKLDLAYDYIQKAHKMKPDNKAILDSMGWIYYKRGDLLKAEHYLRDALNGNQTDADTLRHIIIVLEAQNKTKEAQFYQGQLDDISGTQSSP